MSQKLSLVACILVTCVACTPPELTQREPNFENVAPILTERCGISGCHGNPANGNFMIPNGQQATLADVRVSLEDEDTSDGDPLIVSGSPQESALYLRLIAEPPELMPPNNPLSSRDIELIRRWIREGAEYE